MADPIASDNIITTDINNSGATIDVIVEFTPYAVVAADSRLIGMKSCKLCGAAIILDARDGTFRPDEVHRQWHRREMLRRLRR